MLNFKDFRKRLEALTQSGSQSAELLDRKWQIEAQLTPLICRTERNWYYEDDLKGVEELRSSEGGDALPNVGELRDFERIAKRLMAVGESPCGRN